jgi:hypothetical protein
VRKSKPSPQVIGIGHGAVVKSFTEVLATFCKEERQTPDIFNTYEHFPKTAAFSQGDAEGLWSPNRKMHLLRFFDDGFRQFLTRSRYCC